MAESEQVDNVVKQQLSLSARPQTLDGLLGQDKLVAAIRGHFKSGRFPKAWLFAGSKGTGKTTTARILALSYQCEHQKTFGRPCKVCRQTSSGFAINEISAAVLSKKEDMAGALSGAYSGVMGDGIYRVYIINEIQRAGPGCLSQFLDMLEDTPPTTVFIFTTTEPGKLSDAFRSRCISYEFRDLEMVDVEKLVERLLSKVGSDLPTDRLAEALADNMVRSPRLIAQAVEKYCAGCEPADAAMVSGAATIDIMALSRAITRGLWGEAARYLQNVSKEDARYLRVLLLNYLNSQLLETPDMGPRGDAVAKAISLMSMTADAENALVFAAICSSVYALCKLFAKYSM